MHARAATTKMRRGSGQEVEKDVKENAINSSCSMIKRVGEYKAKCQYKQ